MRQRLTKCSTAPVCQQMPPARLLCAQTLPSIISMLITSKLARQRHLQEYTVRKRPRRSLRDLRKRIPLSNQSLGMEPQWLQEISRNTLNGPRAITTSTAILTKHVQCCCILCTQGNHFAKLMWQLSVEHWWRVWRALFEHRAHSRSSSKTWAASGIVSLFLHQPKSFSTHTNTNTPALPPRGKLGEGSWAKDVSTQQETHTHTETEVN